MVRSYPLEFSMLNEACIPSPIQLICDLKSPFLPEGYSRVLEIGCSDGAFRKNLLSVISNWALVSNSSPMV